MYCLENNITFISYTWIQLLGKNSTYRYVNWAVFCAIPSYIPDTTYTRQTILQLYVGTVIQFSRQTLQDSISLRADLWHVMRLMVCWAVGQILLGVLTYHFGCRRAPGWLFCWLNCSWHPQEHKRLLLFCGYVICFLIWTMLQRLCVLEIYLFNFQNGRLF